MYPESVSIEFVEQCLREGRLDDITNVPGFAGPLASTPELFCKIGIRAEFPADALRPAVAWTRFQRAMRERKFPNPFRSQRNFADSDFLSHNWSAVLLRALGVPCTFQCPTTPDFHHRLVVLPTPDGQASEVARRHIYRPERRIWSLRIVPLRDDSGFVPDSEPWQYHAAYLGARRIESAPNNYFGWLGWIGAEEIAHCPMAEESFDYLDRTGRPRVKTYSCRRVDSWVLRPIAELFELLEGWNFERLNAEGRLNPQPPLFGLKAKAPASTTTQ